MSVNNNKAFYRAAKEGNIGKFFDLLRKDDIDVNWVNDEWHGFTPIHMGSAGGHTIIVSKLISKNADINKYNNYNETPLLYASLWGNVDIVQMLLSEGANYHTIDIYGRTPREASCRYDKIVNKQEIVDIFDRWPVTMTILCLKEIGLYHWVDMSLIDLNEFIGAN